MKIEPFEVEKAIKWAPVTLFFGLMLYTGSQTVRESKQLKKNLPPYLAQSSSVIGFFATDTKQRRTLL